MNSPPSTSGVQPAGTPCRAVPAGNAEPSGLIVLLLAFTAAAVVANLYYNQPLLTAIAGTFRVGAAQAAWITTATQLGYAAGLLFILPWGDAIDRKLLIVITTLSSAAALLCVTLVHSFAPLLLASFCLGAISITPQLAVPYPATLAPANRRGRTVGQVMGGLLVGILLSRTVSGFIGSHASWQTVYWLAAALMLALGAVLWLALPSQRTRQPLGYLALLASLSSLYAHHRVLRRHSFLGAAGFGAFSMFWTTIAFYLQAPAFTRCRANCTAGSTRSTWCSTLWAARPDRRWRALPGPDSVGGASAPHPPCWPWPAWSPYGPVIRGIS